MIGRKTAITFASASGQCDIFANAYYPAEGVKLKCVLLIAHGMAEHHERYEDFISFLNDSGIVVFMHDHLGHGKSVKNDSYLGFFGEKGGYLFLIEDVKQLYDIARREFPDLPVFLFGHSMGSFVSRLYTEKYGDTLSGAIYCGTSGPNPAAAAGKSVIQAIIKLKGGYYRSSFIDKLAFGSFNKKFKPQRTGFDWLTRDNLEVDKYIADPYCGFLFTAFGYRDLMNLIIIANRPDWYVKMPSQLPLLLISGDMDPVGNYGKGVKEVYNGLIDSKHTDVSLKLYKGGRHEILNETNKCDVYKDVVAWIDTVLN